MKTYTCYRIQPKDESLADVFWRYDHYNDRVAMVLPNGEWLPCDLDAKSMDYHEISACLCEGWATEVTEAAVDDVRAGLADDRD